MLALEYTMLLAILGLVLTVLLYLKGKEQESRQAEINAVAAERGAATALSLEEDQTGDTGRGIEARGKDKLEQEEDEHPSVASKTKKKEAIGQVIHTFSMFSLFYCCNQAGFEMVL